MKRTENYETLSGVMNKLNSEGYTENFRAEDDCIKAIYSKKAYSPEELKIVKTFRFEGMTNPADQSELFAIESTDGLKGTLSMNYSADQSQNVELIKEIPEMK
jgi:hypothetical protein